ncbi:MAG TPA: DUF4112 domain-containing protein [Clostridia bacterium]|nr:DUF4112 domain-containing protein [Clostridia bacterium]
MRPRSEPQVLPPLSARSNVSDETLEILATLLDDMFRIPGTTVRFGLDPLIGLLPGVGDAMSGAASLMIIFAAWQRGLPKVTLSRMVANVAVDSLLGSIPFVGDAFDVAYKSNRKNLNLLKRVESEGRRQQEWHDWLFMVLLVAAVMVLVAAPLVLLWWVLTLIRK